MRIHERSATRCTRRTPRAARAADTERYGRVPTWHADGDIMRTAYVDHAEDDDWGQAGTLVRDVLDDAARDRLVDNVVGHLLNGVTEPVLAARVRATGATSTTTLGDRIEEGVRAKAGPHGPEGGGAGQPRPVEHAGESLGQGACSATTSACSSPSGPS